MTTDCCNLKHRFCSSWATGVSPVRNTMLNYTKGQFNSDYVLALVSGMPIRNTSKPLPSYFPTNNIEMHAAFGIGKNTWPSNYVSCWCHSPINRCNSFTKLSKWVTHCTSGFCSYWCMCELFLFFFAMYISPFGLIWVTLGYLVLWKEKNTCNLSLQGNYFSSLQYFNFSAL